MYPALKKSYRRITVRLRNPNADILRHHPNKGIPEEKFVILAGQFPSYLAAKNRIEMMLPIGHPDLELFLKAAEYLSLNIEPDRARKSQVEILDYSKYTEAEIAGAPFVECVVHSPNFDGSVDLIEDDIFAFDEEIASSAAQEFGALTNLPRLIIVRGSAKFQLEGAGLQGLSLEQIPLQGGGNWPPEIEPLYLVRSSITLPSADIMVFDDSGCVKPSSQCDWTSQSTRWYPLDGYEVDPILKYRCKIPHADIALTKEKLGGAGEAYRRIIYSQKAKLALERIGMKVDCVPVRIDS